MGRKAASPVGTVGLPVSKGIVTMKLKRLTLIAILFGASFSLLADTLVFADTRSATARVSCTILPMIEIPEITSDGSAVSVKTNLGRNYALTESFRKTGNEKVKLYSITVL